MMKKIFFILLCVSWWAEAEAQVFETIDGYQTPGTNGFFDIDFGVRYDLGRNQFYRDAETKRQAYAQRLTGHNWPRFAVNTVASALPNLLGG